MRNSADFRPTKSRWSRASSILRRQNEPSVDESAELRGLKQQSDGRIEPHGIVLIEPRQSRAIKIKHAQQPPILQHRNDDLRLGRGVARDVSRKCFHVLDDDGVLALRSDAAYAPSQGNPHAGDLALE